MSRSEGVPFLVEELSPPRSTRDGRRWRRGARFGGDVGRAAARRLPRRPAAARGGALLGRSFDGRSRPGSPTSTGAAASRSARRPGPARRRRGGRLPVPPRPDPRYRARRHAGRGGAPRGARFDALGSPRSTSTGPLPARRRAGRRAGVRPAERSSSRGARWLVRAPSPRRRVRHPSPRARHRRAGRRRRRRPARGPRARRAHRPRPHSARAACSGSTIPPTRPTSTSSWGRRPGGGGLGRRRGPGRRGRRTPPGVARRARARRWRPTPPSGATRSTRPWLVPRRRCTARATRPGGGAVRGPRGDRSGRARPRPVAAEAAFEGPTTSPPPPASPSGGSGRCKSSARSTCSRPRPPSASTRRVGRRVELGALATAAVVDLQLSAVHDERGELDLPSPPPAGARTRPGGGACRRCR